MYPLARWVIFLVNFLLVLLALVQVTGRLFMPWLANLEGRINFLLAGQHIEISGLRGDWLQLNPVIRLTSLRLPAGEMRGLVLQPDLLESALRGALVMRRARVDSGHLALARTEKGWWLAGMQRRNQASPIDLETLLLESDELSGALRLTFLDADPKSLDSQFAAVNRGGRHAVDVRLNNGECIKCSFELRIDRTDSVPFLHPTIHEGYVAVHGFVIPPPLVGRASIDLGRIEGSWQHREQQGRGAVTIRDLRVAAEGLNDFVSSADFRVWAADDIGGIGGDVSMRSGTDEISVGNVNVHYADQQVQLWVDQVDLSAVNHFAGKVTAPTDRINRWFQGLAARGEANDVWAFVRRSDRDDDPPWNFGYGARLTHVHTRAFNGVPEIHDAGAEIVGHRRGFAATITSPDLRVAFPETFARGWDATQTTGTVQVWIRPGFSAVLGRDLKATALGINTRGSFAVANHQALPRKQMTLLVTAEKAGVLAAKTFVPRNLDEGLLRWLDEGPSAGRLTNVKLALQGQLKSAGIEHARRIEIRAGVEKGRVRYHPDWPVIENLSGELALRGSDVSFLATSGKSMGVDMIGSNVEVHNKAADVEINLEAMGDGEALLAFVRSSPLIEQMRFIKPEWALGGSIRLHGRVDVPLKSPVDSERKTHARLEGVLDAVSLELPDLRLSVADLKGELQFVTPLGITAESLTGTLWGDELTLDIQPGSDHLWFRASGHLPYDRALSIAGLADPGFASGRMSYHADIGIATQKDATTEISITSELEGVSLDLPRGLAKDADELTPSTVGVQLLADYSAISFQYRDMQGWLHIKDSPLRGAIGIGAPPPMIDLEEDVVSISGRLHRFQLTEWTRLFAGQSGSGNVSTAPAFERWQVDDLRIDRARIGDLAFDDLIVSGRPTKDRVAFEFLAQDIEGSATFGGSLPIEINIGLLRFPAAEPPAPVDPNVRVYGPHQDKDPLSESLIANLPEANVQIEQIYRGEEDFGSWRFNLRKPASDVVQIETLVASVKGLEIQSTAPMLWTAVDDMSTFKGEVAMKDLAQVLPLWRYAPSVASESAQLKADVRWSGSPLNVTISGMVGAIDFSAKNGRFLEVESGSGAMRIMSLFSFTAIIKRLNFNFSDVIGKGVGFETLEAGIDLRDRVLTFVKPMEVRSTSSDFRLGGRVNMATGALDNELVITLPVSKNLPWYGVYIALANPLAGLGVLVGERMLRKPLEQFSSAKYTVRGTLAEPDVRFVELFDAKLTEPVAVITQPTVAPVAASAEPDSPVDGDSKGTRPSSSGTESSQQDDAPKKVRE
jgi:uncharacterized protein (TIGR02099 family)